MKNKRLAALMAAMLIGLFSVAYAETVTTLTEAQINAADAEREIPADVTSAAAPAEAAAAAVPQPMPAPPAPPRQGEAVNWWNGGNGMVPVGQPIQLVDVWTGKTFMAVRTYGHNHADMEPATQADTQIMKSIWGGSWSWERRPFVAVINGRNIAVSCAGMPHAGLDRFAAEAWVKGRSGGFGSGLNLDKVKGNGVDGHFDMHLLSSKTHGTGRVDPKHQAMIKIAAGN